MASSPQEQSTDLPIEGDLEAELNQLLAQMTSGESAKSSSSAKSEPTPTPTPPTEVESSSDASISALADALMADAGEGKSPAPVESVGEDLVGDALAQQIQELLDDAEAQLDSADFLDPSQLSMSDTAADNAADPAADSTQKTGATAPVAASAAAVDSSTVAAGVVSASSNLPDDPQAIQKAVEKLDDSLAQEADEAMAGDFETVADVVGSQSATNGNDAWNQETQNPLAGATQAGGDHGSVVSTDPNTPAAGAGASAQDLANELDTQPEKAALSTAEIQDPPAPSKRRKPLTHRLRAALAAANGPVATLSPSNRDLVGYTGAVTIMTAVLWITLTLLC